MTAASSLSLSVAILGVTGRMGRALLANLDHLPALTLGAALTAPDDPLLDTAVAALGAASGSLRVSADLSVVADCDVLIDFSRPAATLAALPHCRRGQTALVIGTTGFDDGQLAELARAAELLPLCRAANFSVGVNVCLSLLEQAARALDGEYEVEIFEAHHRHKVDAPSGTALAMGEAVAQGRGRRLADVALWQRHGHTGPRPPDAIGFSVMRAGDIVGEHVVTFAGPGERVEIAHRASSRDNFARGALRAAGWLAGRPPGAYDMRDVLGLNAR
jgi:dihydrodipicolinate reductase (EC 1.3.1.26)